MTTRGEIINIFMQRDGESLEDATQRLRDAIDECLDAITIGDDVEEVWMDATGLEPDYLYTVLFEF